MRPIKLTMTAFGPYKDIEVVDFRELGNRNLFLITGPTGAGKTTIFDAISFAIYGEASGNMRSADSLRSHFSEDQLLTEVELEFELKGTRYHIHRIPKQSKPKARGEGTTDQKPDATLTIFDGEPNTIVAGVKNVNEKVEAILGINAEQFRQIMMIPQGEFQKLLTSSTEERERVLQQLFDTGIYNTIQMKLDMQAKSLYAEIKRSREIRDHEITRIECPEQEELQALIAADDKLIAEIVALTGVQIEKDQTESSRLEEAIKATQGKIEKHIAAREKAKEDNEKLKAKEAIGLKLAEKERASDEIALLDTRVKKAEKAQMIVPVEMNYQDRKTDLESKNKELSTLNSKLEQAQIQAKEAEAAYLAESSPEKMKQREQFIEELARLRSYEDKVKRIEDVTLSISAAEKQCKQIEVEKQKNSDFVTNGNKSIEGLRLKRDEAKDAEIKAAGRKEALNRIKDIGRKLKKMLETMSEFITEDSRHKAEEGLAKELLERMEASTRQYKEAKLDSLMNQAAVLAKDLKENDPCPVCGSTHHIALAKFSEHAVTEEQLIALEEALKALEVQYIDKKTTLAILEERINKLAASGTELMDELSGMIMLQRDHLSAEDQQAYIKEQIAENRSEQLKIESELTALEQSAKAYETLTADIAKLTADIKAAEEKQSEMTAKHLETSRTLSEQKTTLSHIFAEVPEPIRNSAKLTEAIKAQETLQRQSSEKLDSTRKAYEETKATLITLNANKDQLSKDVVSASEILEKALQSLNAKITESDFSSLEDYTQAKLPPETISRYKNQIDQHGRELHALKEQLADLNHKTKDLQPVDITLFEAQIEALRAENTAYATTRSAAINRITNNTKILSEIETINTAIGDKEAIYNVLGNLAKVAQGNNPARITFERYVLAAFLEDIITAANIRLNQMTSGRYKLSRTEELQRSNAKGGLELEVYDNYTGKSRHVKTLSGGEGFKASLAMALGLADVVQSYAGGVQLDTMFIDEGFGTLDQESLDSAISCLIDLQKTGRLVGIISHVQELKERVDTRLEVYSSNMGSGTRFVVG